MKLHSSTLLAIALAGVVPAAGAQSLPSGFQDGDRQNGYRNDPYANQGMTQTDTARVVRVVRVQRVPGYVQQPARNCRNDGSYQGGYGSGYGNAVGGYDRYGNPDRYGAYDRYGNRVDDRGVYDERRARGTETGRQVASVIGGVVGAVLGSQVGGGSARYATSAIGSMVGGIAGRQVYEQSRQPRASVAVCDMQQGNGYRTADEYDVTYEYAGRQYTTRMPYDPGARVPVTVDVRPR